MTKYKELLFSVALALAGTTSPTAEPIVDVILPGPEFAPTNAGTHVLINPFTSEPAPGIFLAKRSDPEATIVRITPVDSSSSAFTVEPLDNSLSSAFHLASNTGEGIYAVGYGPQVYNRRYTQWVWKVRRSAWSDKGNTNTWRDDDTFYFTTTSKSKAVTVHSSIAHGIAADSTGVLFATGSANDGTSERWIIRRKIPGENWATVYNVRNDNINTGPALVAIPGAIFAVGDLNNRWCVLRSTAQGAPGTWYEVDAWPEGPSESQASEAACDQAGTIYVAGFRGVNGKYLTGWVIRRSSDGGNTWQTMLDVSGPSVTCTYGIAVDPYGTVSVSGSVTLGDNIRRWKVIRCTNPGDSAAWAASFDSGFLPFGDAPRSGGTGMAADSAGNLFVTGFVSDWTDENGVFYSGASGPRLGLVRIVP